MPTLAEKLKGISSLPGAAVKSVRKKGPSAEGGVARSRRRGCKVFIISHSVNVSVTLTRCFRVCLVTSCSFFFVFFHVVDLSSQTIVKCSAFVQVPFKHVPFTTEGEPQWMKISK